MGAGAVHQCRFEGCCCRGRCHVQIDEPAFWIMPGGLPEMVEVFNVCVKDVNANHRTAFVLWEFSWETRDFTPQ